MGCSQMGVKKIVVAYDGSVQSKKALQWAVTLAQSVKCQLFGGFGHDCG